MTEEEAETKWCPFVRFSGPDNVDNRPPGMSDNLTRCIGSRCMAWRKFRGSSINEDATGGYCGLAGPA